jgi:hypothetical protein
MRDKEVIARTWHGRRTDWMSRGLKWTVALSALLAAGTVAGCGGSSHKIVFSNEVNEQIAADEYARAVNLRPEDLPGMERVTE